jgi:serine O-acetyltransferase
MRRLRDDWRRHGGIDAVVEPGYWALGVYRLGRWAQRRESGALRWVGGKVYRVLHVGVHLTMGASVPREVEIGDALHIIHGNGLRIHPSAVIGDRVTIMHEVTIGQTVGRDGAPKIGNDVFIGAGAKLLGPITVGDGALIAANSLVVTDVPAGATVMGVPARVVPSGSGAPRR